MGISLDGDARMHDRSRRRANGRGSHSLVMAALRRLTAPTYRDLFAGLICTVDLRNDPVAAYEALLQPAPPAIDFLLPLGNWSAPPPGRTDDPAATPYADWLIPIFDRWYHAPRRPTRVRLFDEILRLLLGGQSGTEQIGLSPAAMIVIETDGSLNQSDLLKSAYENATATGLHLTSDSLDTALLLPGFAARQIGPRALAPACRSCPVARVCGGGLYAHRYRAGRGFANPSVYCPDLLALITHIKQTVEADLRHRLTSPKGQRPCT